MDVSCGNCGRTFDLDQDRTAGLGAAKCLCGSRLDLTSGGGERLGKYILQNRIAVGGMGEIYYGKMAGVAGFEREIAIKRMLPHLSADKSFIDMMIKEAKLTVLLNHPNIVQVFDLGREGDEYYIAMEYVEGINVGTLLETCRKSGVLLPWKAAVHITMQVLRGLAYAHGLVDANGESMQILHRDITPQNIMVSRGAWVKIADFGIAKARNEISTTSPGMIKGKLGYIAPEQLQGKEADQRIDLFCAGILLWESLACRRLFKGASEIDTFRLISESKIPPLSEVRDDVPDPVQAVIRRSLSRERDDRYLHADDFYNALQESLSPDAPDDCRTDAVDFFTGHPEFFASIEGHKAGATEDPTAQLDIDIDIGSDDNLINVATLLNEGVAQRRPTGDQPAQPLIPEELTVRKTQGKGKGAMVATIFGLFLLLGVGGAWKFKDTLLAPGAGAGATAAAGITSGGLSGEEVQLATDGERTRVLNCYKRGNSAFWKLAVLEAKLVIPSTGGVAAVTFVPSKGLGKVSGCLDEVLRSLQFRRHNLPRFDASVTLPAPKASKAAVVGSDKGSGKGSGGNKGPRTPTGSLTAQEIQKVVRKNQTSIARCLGTIDRATAPSKVTAVILIETSGKVGRVDLRPSVGTPDAETCLSRALKGMRFRRHPDVGFQVTIPLKIEVRGT